MKPFSYLTLISIFLLLFGCKETIKKTSTLTNGELINKAIAFHDPQKKWDDYSGKVHLITAWPDGNTYGEEIIEVQTKEGFYQCTRIAGDLKTIKGIKNGECFREVNGNSNPGEDQIKKYDLGCENIRYFKAWHYAQIGLLMELKASGLILEDKVEAIKFQGNNCFALTFTCDSNKVKNSFYKGTNWTIYLDPVYYSMKGFKEVSKMNIYAVFSGILIVDNIKIPLSKTYFKNEDNSFICIDLITNANDTYKLK